ncbi:MAG: immunity 26/phosphotriesterase HocA family protein [Alistipes sp.]|jgi:hypothetical protein|nr:immunity 26/phosphotriesterase HocA family protein [Alistipes sp.]
MDGLKFELTNEQRRYLGLAPVEAHWELVQLGEMWLWFDGDVIRKQIIVDEDGYYECELNEKTAENRTILLPKTAKGKPKKLNFTGTQSFGQFGVYFRFGEYVTIASYTTQTTFYSEELGESTTIDDLQAWLDGWMADSSEEDLREIDAFREAKRQHCKFAEGDFFAIRIGRRRWGFGRILIDVARRRKTEEFKAEGNYGLDRLMGKPLIVKVYHKIADTLDVDLDELAACAAMPAQAVMDNHFYYGENRVIGHRDVTIEDYGDDLLISYSRGLSRETADIIYLQYGLIYRESTLDKFCKYLVRRNPERGYDEENPYRNESIGFGLDTDELEACIAAGSNEPYWSRKNFFRREMDLRNPCNAAVKREIFGAFGLDGDKGYAENLALATGVSVDASDDKASDAGSDKISGTAEVKHTKPSIWSILKRTKG